MASMIVSASEFVPAQHMLYTKPKANNAGGKSVGILNTLSRKALYLNTPLMMTWGANSFDNPNLIFTASFTTLFVTKFVPRLGDS